MQQAPFIEASSAIPPNAAERELIACQHAALKEWRKKAAANECKAAEIDSDEEMFDNAIMTDKCLTALARSGGGLWIMINLSIFFAHFVQTSLPRTS